MSRPLCAHCNRLLATRARGLCWGCHLKPDVRALYATTVPTEKRRWTAKERKSLRRWRAAGVSIPECARRLGRTTTAVDRVCTLRGIRTRPRRAPIGARCWACPAVCPQATHIASAGWVRRVIVCGGAKTLECYCGPCFAQYGWPESREVRSA